MCHRDRSPKGSASAMKKIDFDCPCGERLTAGLIAGDRRKAGEVRFYARRRPLRRLRRCPRCERDFAGATLDAFCRTVFS